MVEVTVDDVVVRVLKDAPEGETRLANERMRVVLLKEAEGDRVVPIWVGPPEGDALALQLGGESMPRPMTADLMARLVEATEARIDRVAVNSLRDKTFYATVTVRTGDRATEVDARPSDAFNLALRTGAPVFVDSEVIDQSGIAAGEADERMVVLEREFRQSLEGAEQEPEEPGEWQSLSPELVKALYPRLK